MAIKGKSKPKARRAVTPGPRPAYVPVRKKWYARREVQVGVAIVVLVAAVAGTWFGVARSRTKARDRQQQQLMRSAATSYQSQVNQALSGVGQPLPPSGFSVLPSLRSDLEGLQKGSLSANAAQKDATSASAAAAAAAKALDKIDVTGLVSGKGIADDAFVLDMINSRSRMSQALKLYRTAAQLVTDGAQASGDARAKLLDRASSILDVAGGLFADGFTDYVNAQGTAKIFQPILPTGGSPIGGS